MLPLISGHGHALTSTGAPTVLLSISPTRALVPFRLAILACTRSRMALMSVESRLVGAVWCGSAESPVLRKRPGPTTQKKKSNTKCCQRLYLPPRPPALDTKAPAVCDFLGVASIFMVHVHPRAPLAGLTKAHGAPPVVPVRIPRGHAQHPTSWKGRPDGSRTWLRGQIHNLQGLGDGSRGPASDDTHQSHAVQGVAHVCILCTW